MLRLKPPLGTRVDFEGLERQRNSREQRSMAMLWHIFVKKLKIYRGKFRPNFMPAKAQRKLRKLLTFSRKSGRLEELHTKYLAGINERKR